MLAQRNMGLMFTKNTHFTKQTYIHYTSIMSSPDAETQDMAQLLGFRTLPQHITSKFSPATYIIRTFPGLSGYNALYLTQPRYHPHTVCKTHRDQHLCKNKNLPKV